MRKKRVENNKRKFDRILDMDSKIVDAYSENLINVWSTYTE